MEKAVTTLVIHVRGQQEREKFIAKQLEALDFPCEFVLDGNVADLTPDVLDRYFADDGKADSMHGLFPRTSCAYKHLLAYQRIVGGGLHGALILEDDIRLKKHFKEHLLQCLSELEQKHQDEPSIVNFEESALLLVPRSERRKGQYLYEAKRDRFAGCLYVSQEAAKVLVDFAAQHKIDRPFDRIHSMLTEQGLIRYYWSHPCLACQCSCDGSMPTMIPTRPRPFKRLKWFYKRGYKHLLYWFR